MGATSQLKVNSLQIINAAGEASYLMVVNGILRVLTPSEAANQYALSPTMVNQPSGQLTADPSFVDYVAPIVTSLLAGGAFAIGSNGLSIAGALALTGGFTASTTSAHGASASLVWTEELLTLSTIGATTDTTANLLLANSLILAAFGIINTTITTAATFSLGDGTTAARFVSASNQITAPQTTIGTLQWAGGITTDATGPTQAAAAKLRVTANTTPGAGIMRVATLSLVFGALTS